MEKEIHNDGIVLFVSNRTDAGENGARLQQAVDKLALVSATKRKIQIVIVGSEEAVKKRVPVERRRTIEAVVVDSAVEEILSLTLLPSLRLVASSWAGVDSLMGAVGALNDAVTRNGTGNCTLGPAVLLVRLVDPLMAQRMTQTVTGHVLGWHLGLGDYSMQQRRREWRKRPAPPPSAVRRVVLLGFGALGLQVARALVSLGFTDLAAWATSPRSVPISTITTSDAVTIHTIQIRAGHDALTALFSSADVVINLLPLTPASENSINYTLFSKMLRKHSVFMNFGRGRTVVADDLLRAIDDPSVGLNSAVLDVFATEPLSNDSPLWNHPKITITPHIAAVTDYSSAANTLANTLAKFYSGKFDFEGLVDFEKGF
ncbi:hypothetical protein HK100_011629 [Physocladia obscura]|uniref:D-isomer specific 2-hydroxyacid dehydrogenase NAD-binding domain-containing protein n=1 Tax=Physocladia obscura TaxID=109957 RepID=A0AAD5XI65_9FUNG|nr:hypothetical protein HK100_011629 [Physocladia obscura]